MYRALRILLVALLAPACAADELPFEASDAVVEAKPTKDRPDSPGKGKPGKPTQPDTTTPPDTTPPPPPPPTDTTTPPPSGGGSDWMGEVLFTEGFDDADFTARGWYDVDQPRITTAERAPGSSASFECRYPVGATECAGGVPGRRQFEGQNELYFSYWAKYGSDWVGSGRSYHPHEFHFLTNADGRWAGPSFSRLTVYIEQVGGRPRVALQDGMNVDTNCILRNDDTAIGCNGGTVDTYPFGENRSVASCNGLVGPVDGRDCFDLGGGSWYSARWWSGPQVLGAGTGWHFVETYVRLNTIADGTGIADGEIRQWVDGEATVVAEGVLLRTGNHPSMLLDQLLVAPYIGDGSPVDQTVWFDEVTVARGKRP